MPCEIIEDLLPSYVDGLTNEITNEAVSSHLDTCESCEQKYNRMRTPEQGAATFEEEKEIDFLKKNKKKTRISVLVAVALSVALAVAVLFVRFFLIGNVLTGESVICNVEVTDNKLEVKGGLIDSGLSVTSVSFEEKDGVVNLKFRAALVSIFNKGMFQDEYEAKNEIRQVRIGDRILWEEGEEISSRVSDVYNTKHPYVGNASENGQTAMALGMPQYLGSYTIELQTKEEPYEWKFCMEKNIITYQQSQQEAMMKSYACVLLAMVDNLSVVSYEYYVDGEMKILSVTLEDASVFAGLDVKEHGKSAAALQKLMEQVGLAGLTEYAIVEEKSNQETINFKVINNSEDAFQWMEIFCNKNGAVISSQGCMNADNSLLRKGESVQFELYPEDFGVTSFERAEEISIELSLTDENEQTYVVNAPMYFEGESGNIYQYVITGNAEDGYRVEQ